MNDLIQQFNQLSRNEQLLVGSIGIAAALIIVFNYRRIMTYIYLLALLAGVYLVGAVFIAGVPQLPSVIMAVGLAAVVVILTMWRIDDLWILILRLVIRLAALAALIFLLITPILPKDFNQSLNATARLFVGVNPAFVAVVALLIPITLLYSRRVLIKRRERIDTKNNNTNTNIDIREQTSRHTRDERDYRYSTDNRTTSMTSGQPTPTGTQSTAQIRAILESLEVRLANGEISEQTFKEQTAKWRQRLKELGG